MLLVQLRALVDRMETFHAVESISCHIKAFIWEAGVGWMSSPWSRYSYSYIVFWSWLNVKLHLIVLYMSGFANTSFVLCYFDVHLLNWSWSQSLAKESIYKQDIVFLLSLFNQTDYELHPSSSLICRNVMITIEKPSEFSVKVIYCMCPKCRHLPYTRLPFTVGWWSLVTWPKILHVYWTIKVNLKWLLKLKH